MICYGHNDYRDYLAHHGILGQKWGKKNGPPYPLAYGDHSALEKRAGWQSSIKYGESSSEESKKLRRKKEKEKPTNADAIKKSMRDRGYTESEIAKSFEKKEKEKTKLTKFVNKETQKINKYYDKQIDESDKIIRDLENRAVSNRGGIKGSKKEIIEALDTEKKIRSLNIARKRVEKMAIWHYTYDDLKKEKRYMITKGTAATTSSMLKNKIYEISDSPKRVIVPTRRELKANYRADYEKNRRAEQRRLKNEEKTKKKQSE